MQTILKRGIAYTRMHIYIIRVAWSIRAELCNLHTRRMEIRVSRAQSRNCRLVYSILHRPSMIQLSLGSDVVSDRLYPAYTELPMKHKYKMQSRGFMQNSTIWLHIRSPVIFWNEQPTIHTHFCYQLFKLILQCDFLQYDWPMLECFNLWP